MVDKIIDKLDEYRYTGDMETLNLIFEKIMFASGDTSYKASSFLWSIGAIGVDFSVKDESLSNFVDRIEAKELVLQMEALDKSFVKVVPFYSSECVEDLVREAVTQMKK